MQIDLYTKTVLTVIAGCLVYLCFAKTAPTPVIAADPKAGAAVQTVRVEGVIPVRIAAVERMQNPQTGQWSEWQPLWTKEQK